MFREKVPSDTPEYAELAKVGKLAGFCFGRGLKVCVLWKSPAGERVVEVCCVIHRVRPKFERKSRLFESDPDSTEEYPPHSFSMCVQRRSICDMELRMTA